MWALSEMMVAALPSPAGLARRASPEPWSPAERWQLPSLAPVGTGGVVGSVGEVHASNSDKPMLAVLVLTEVIANRTVLTTRANDTDCAAPALLQERHCHERAVVENEPATGHLVGAVRAIIENDSVQSDRRRPGQLDPAAGPTAFGRPFFGVVTGIPGHDPIDGLGRLLCGL